MNGGRGSGARRLKHEGKARTHQTTGTDPYRPTTKEVAVIGKLARDLEAKAPVPSLKLSDDAKRVLLNHPNHLVGLGLFMNAIGTENSDFANGIMCQVGHVSLTQGEKDDNKLNFALSVITGDEPKDQEETMLSVLKAASYLSAVNMAVRLQNAQTMMDADLAERAFNKCARTFAMMVEARQRKRSDSEQNIVVQNNVSLNDNAQAVVGNVSGQQVKEQEKKDVES